MKRDQITRLKVLERDNYTCQCCGFFGKETHHKKLLINGGEDEEENMETLCSKCHYFSPENIYDYNKYKNNGGFIIPYLYGKVFVKIKNSDLKLKELSKQIEILINFMRINSFKNVRIKKYLCEKCKTRRLNIKGICNVCKKNNLFHELENELKNPSNKNMVILFKRGVSMNEIAKQYNVSITPIRRILKERGEI